MLLKKNGVAYVWLVIFSTYEIDTLNSHTHILGDEAIPDTQKSILLDKWCQHDNTIFGINSYKSPLLCLFGVPLTADDTCDWNCATVVSWTYVNEESWFNISILASVGSELQFTNEVQKFFTNVLICSVKFLFINPYDRLQKFQTYWNCVVDEIPYKNKRGYISDMCLVQEDSIYNNICIKMQIDGVWDTHWMPYTQTLLERIVIEKLETQKVYEIKKMVLEDE